MKRNGFVPLCLASAPALFSPLLRADTAEAPTQVSINVIADGKTSAQIVLALPKGAELGWRAGKMIPTPGNDHVFRLIGDANIATRLNGVDLDTVHGDELVVSKEVLDAGRIAARAELEAMLATDQSVRTRVADQSRQEGNAWDSRRFASEWKEQEAIDGRNQLRLAAIVKEYGWPNFAWAGRDGILGAFLVVQHAELNFQRSYLPLLRQAAANGNLSYGKLAYLEDRVRVREGRKQIYGTQLHSSAGGKQALDPIEDEANVDARRAKVGLEPLSEYLKGFNLEEKPLSH
ncbi:MAG TPA: DUF6624 domain-containing protein [Rudaea sp.]|nr:DUF6624 domain-containing protein [Rudaea sp.]